jgi:hypothetical protein
LEIGGRWRGRGRHEAAGRSGAWRPVRGAGPEGEPDAPQLPPLRLRLAAAGAGPPRPAPALQIHRCLRRAPAAEHLVEGAFHLRERDHLLVHAGAGDEFRPSGSVDL